MNKKSGAPKQAGWAWCIASAREELLVLGEALETAKEKKQFSLYVESQLQLFQTSKEWRAAHSKYVRQHRKQRPELHMTHWQIAALILSDVVWESYRHDISEMPASFQRPDKYSS